MILRSIALWVEVVLFFTAAIASIYESFFDTGCYYYRKKKGRHFQEELSLEVAMMMMMNSKLHLLSAFTAIFVPSINAFLLPTPASSSLPLQKSSSSSPIATSSRRWTFRPLYVLQPPPPAKHIQIDPRLQSVVYDGPKAEGELEREVGAVLEEYSLVLEVGPSLAVPGERGLFIRMIGDDVQESTVEWGSILCGYGEGEMRPEPGSGDKSVFFSVSSPEVAVFFNKELVPLFEVLAELPDGCGLLGHEVSTDHKGATQIKPQSGFEGPKYFVPKEGIPGKAAFIGLFANDLAIRGEKTPTSTEEYETASDTGNIAALVWRVDFDKKKNVVVPTRPVVTFGRTVSFKNKEPMEVGLRYGWRFWSRLQEGSSPSDDEEEKLRM